MNQQIQKRLSLTTQEIRDFCKQNQIQELSLFGSVLRDRLIHDYDEVSIDLVWQVVKLYIPELLNYITPLLPNQTNQS